jgi:hypothetical protein
MQLGNTKNKIHKVQINESSTRDFKNMLTSQIFLEKQKQLCFERTFENKVHV